MRKIACTLIAAFCAIFLITACQKELSGVAPAGTVKTDSIKGNWKFIMLDARSTINYSETEAGATVKIVAITDLLTKNNAGVLKIDSSVLNLTGFSYSIDTISKLSTYVNGFLVDKSDEPITYDAAPFSTSSEYELIGSDSIHFPNADFINLPDDLFLPPLTGLKYKIEGDKLKFNTTLILNETDNSSGTVTTITSSAIIVITFQKT